jgi:hypothetical protein
MSNNIVAIQLLPENLAKISGNNQSCFINNEADKTLKFSSKTQQIICKYDALKTGNDNSLLREGFGSMLLEKAFCYVSFLCIKVMFC